MSEGSLQLKFSAGVKKTVKTQFPGVKVKAPTITVLSKCVNEFMSMLVQASAQACEEQNKNTMMTSHVIQAVETLGYSQFVPAIQAKAQKVNQAREERKALIKETPAPVGTLEEQIAQANALREQALQQLREKKARQRQADT